MRWDSAVIFAGGKSSRMGRDKALLPFGGFDTLAEYQHDRLSEWFEHVYISVKEDKFSFDMQAIKDKYPESSPLVALVSALELVNADEVFVLSVDMPYVDEELIGKLYDHHHDNKDSEATVASSVDGREPLCGVYSRKILSKAKTQLQKGDHRMKNLLESCQTLVVKCDRDKIFVNLNTPEQYNKEADGKHRAD